MTLLDRHLGRAVAAWTALVAAVIVCLDLIFRLAGELGESGGGYRAADALTYAAMTTPTSLYELLPFAALGGALTGLGALASGNELVALQAAGVSRWRIARAALQATLAVMLVGLALGEWIAPPLERSAGARKAIQLGGADSINAGGGAWRKVGDEYIHINAIAPDGARLYGLTRYRVGADRRLEEASFAEYAEYAGGDGPSRWRLRNVRASALTGAAVLARERAEETWRVDLSPRLLEVLLVEPDRQSISGLRRFARFFESEGLDGSVYLLAFWKKLLQPLATLSLVLLAVSFVFGPLREATMGYRVFVALGVGLAFTIVQRMLEPVSLIWGFSPPLAAAAPAALCAAAGCLLLRRAG